MPVTLKCSYDNGGLDTEVKWYRGNKEISKSRKYQLSQTGREATLTIKDVQTADSAQYTCLISNSIGKASSAAKVTVSGKSYADAVMQ